MIWLAVLNVVTVACFVSLLLFDYFVTWSVIISVSIGMIVLINFSAIGRPWAVICPFIAVGGSSLPTYDLVNCGFWEIKRVFCESHYFLPQIVLTRVVCVYVCGFKFNDKCKVYINCKNQGTYYIQGLTYHISF